LLWTASTCSADRFALPLVRTSSTASAERFALPTTTVGPASTRTFFDASLGQFHPDDVNELASRLMLKAVAHQCHVSLGFYSSSPARIGADANTDFFIPNRLKR